MEMDEITTSYMLEMVRSQYLIINNLATDSLHRNANPDYVSQRIIEGCNKYNKTVLVINGDDPICCGIGENSPRVFFGVADQGRLDERYLTNDFPVCPKCGSTPVYNYKNYRHFGAFVCPKCGYKSPERDVFIEKINDKIIKFVLQISNGKDPKTDQWRKSTFVKCTVFNDLSKEILEN